MTRPLLPYMNTQNNLVGMMDPDQAALYPGLFVLTTDALTSWPSPIPDEVDLSSDPEHPGYYFGSNGNAFAAVNVLTRLFPQATLDALEEVFGIPALQAAVDAAGSGDATAFVDPADTGVLVIRIGAGGGTPVDPPPTGIAPYMSTQPASASIAEGATATFTAAASGTPAPTVQWQVNGLNITDATQVSYTTPAALPGHSGRVYRAVFTNASGSITSSGATLTVVSAVAPSIATITWPATVESFLSTQVYWTEPTGSPTIDVTIEALPAGASTGTWVNIPWYAAPALLTSGPFSGKYGASPSVTTFVAGTTRRFRLKAANSAGTWYSTEITLDIVDNS